MGDHHISVDCDSQDREERYCNECVSGEGEHSAEDPAVGPGAAPEGGRGERQVEAAEQEVGA